MAEWSKAAVLKTVERKFRGFESYSLRQPLCATGGRREDAIESRAPKQTYGEVLEWLNRAAC